MLDVYKDVEEAYIDIKWTRLLGNKYDDKRTNKHARSKDKVVNINEMFGYAWEVKDPSDVFDLIAKIDENSKDRIKDLEEKGKEFVGGIFTNPPSSRTYTYASRIAAQMNSIVKNIIGYREEPNRQALLSIWHPSDSAHLGEKEVPCSIAYHFIPRDDELHMVYFMRSLDIDVWPNDVYLSRYVQGYVAVMCNMKVGRIIFMVSCLHVFSDEGGL